MAILIILELILWLSQPLLVDALSPPHTDKTTSVTTVYIASFTTSTITFAPSTLVIDVPGSPTTLTTVTTSTPNPSVVTISTSFLVTSSDWNGTSSNPSTSSNSTTSRTSGPTSDSTSGATSSRTSSPTPGSASGPTTSAAPDNITGTYNNSPEIVGGVVGGLFALIIATFIYCRRRSLKRDSQPPPANLNIRSLPISNPIPLQVRPAPPRPARPASLTESTIEELKSGPTHLRPTPDKSSTSNQSPETQDIQYQRHIPEPMVNRPRIPRPPRAPSSVYSQQPGVHSQRFALGTLTSVTKEKVDRITAHPSGDVKNDNANGLIQDGSDVQHQLRIPVKYPTLIEDNEDDKEKKQARRAEALKALEWNAYHPKDRAEEEARQRRDLERTNTKVSAGGDMSGMRLIKK